MFWQTIFPTTPNRGTTMRSVEVIKDQVKGSFSMKETGKNSGDIRLLDDCFLRSDMQKPLFFYFHIL